MICFPNAKINLGLHVINKRPDGFHNIETVFYPVALCDMLEVIENQQYQANKPKCEFVQEGLKVEGDPGHNLVVKAYKLLDMAYGLPPVQAVLYKKIPMGAGLGGGSSDAAFMLRLLNDKFKINMDEGQLAHYAAALGSDCAFFLQKEPAYLFGKGHELEPYEVSLKGLYLVLLYPQVHSNTALAYSRVQRREVHHEETAIRHLLHQPVQHWRDAVHNDFEASVFEVYPQLATMKAALYEAGALFALMSGSGSAVFGLFSEKPELPEELQQYVCYEGLLLR